MARLDRYLDEMYLAVEDIDHTRTKTRDHQTNGICEPFNSTVLDKFSRPMGGGANPVGFAPICVPLIVQNPRLSASR